MTSTKTLTLVVLCVLASQSQADELIQFLGQSTGPAAMNTILTPTEINDANISNPEDFACFSMDMLDPATALSIGTGTDCLIFNAIPGQIANGNGLQNGRAFQNLAGDVAVEAISIFEFDDGDLVVTRGLTSVRPLLEGFGDGGAPARTHITGSIPDPGSNGVIYASGARALLQGPVRVSGSLTVDSNGIFFDCVWIHSTAAP